MKEVTVPILFFTDKPNKNGNIYSKEAFNDLMNLSKEMIAQDKLKVLSDYNSKDTFSIDDDKILGNIIDIDETEKIATIELNVDIPNIDKMTLSHIVFTETQKDMNTEYIHISKITKLIGYQIIEKTKSSFYIRKEK